MTEDVQKQPGSIKWRKIGNGQLALRDGRVIEKGGTFDATLNEIPEGFRDLVLPVSAAELAIIQEPPLMVTDPGYKVVSRGPGVFNVVDGNGKVMNEKALSKAEADDLIAALAGTKG